MGADDVTRTFIFTLTYKLEGKEQQRVVQVSATRSGTDVRMRVSVAGFTAKERKLRPHKHMPADWALMNDAVKLAKSVLPRSASDIQGKDKRG